MKNKKWEKMRKEVERVLNVLGNVAIKEGYTIFMGNLDISIKGKKLVFGGRPDLSVIDKEVVWCEKHPLKTLTKEYREGFIKGLMQAKYLLLKIKRKK